jgi:type VI secretion system secreted protein VgrG
MSDFRLTCGALPSTTVVVGFTGREGLSELYEFELFLLVPSENCADLDLDGVLQAKATLSVARDRNDRDPIAYQGVIRAIEIVYATASTALFRATLGPRHADLTLTEHNLMFTQKSIPDVLTVALSDAAVPTDATKQQLSGSYSPEEHVCQYRESSYAFASRWMHREGMYFFFDHGGDGEVMVVVDDKSAHVAGPATEVRYHPVSAGDASAGQAFSSFARGERLATASVVVRDYDHKKPSLDVSGTKSAATNGVSEIVLHGARAFTAADAARVAGLRAEEVLSAASFAVGRGSVVGLRPGYTFELTDHPDDALNTTYLIVEVRHAARHTSEGTDFAHLAGADFPPGYHVEVAAVPASVQYRAPSRHPWPSVPGFELAKIDSPRSDHYADLDDQGQYTVRFLFDESTLDAGKASTRVRMMQPHAGSPEGFHFPLRKGTEVAMAFLGGDPDRPVIAGALANAQTPSPVTQANHTQNVVQTGGNTRLAVEDQDGGQYVDLSVPTESSFVSLGADHDGGRTHNVVKSTTGDCLFDFGTNQDILVGGNLTETVKDAVSETYSANQTSSVSQKQTTHVTQAVKETYGSLQMTHVSGAREETYGGAQSTAVGGARLEMYNTGQSTTVSGGDTKEKYTGPHTKVAGATTQKLTGAVSTFVAGPVVQVFGGSVDVKYAATTWVAPSHTWIIPGGTTMNCPNWTVHTPKVLWVFDKATFAWATKLAIQGTSRTFTSVQIQIVPQIVAGAAGLRDELDAFAFTMEGPKVVKCAFTAELGAIYVQICALLNRS